MNQPEASPKSLFSEGAKAISYSEDRPNPSLGSFVERHIKARPYDAEADTYAVPAFDVPIETSKATAIYNMHTYWSKKPHDAIRQYIRHYTKPGDLVLDPFCGSGGTILASLMDNRSAIAIDLSPAATFITAGYCAGTPLSITEAWLDKFLREWEDDCGECFHIRCPSCKKEATIDGVIHSDRYECLRCLSKETIYGLKDREYCSKCGDPVTVTKNRRIDMVPVLLSYSCDRCDASGKTSDQSVLSDYVERVKRVEGLLAATPVPRQPIPEARVKTGRMKTTGTTRVDQLYYPRSLYVMARGFALANERPGQERLFLQFCLTAMCLFVTKMHQANETTGGNISKGSYYVPPVNKEMNVFAAFARKAKAVAKGQDAAVLKTTDAIISTQSATRLDTIPSNSIDYIFTDPPYSDKVPFSDLNLPWEAWLGFRTDWTADEIIVHPDQKKGLAEWMDLMRAAMREMYRVLKPGRWISLCYHDTSEGSWGMLQDIAAEAGFVPDHSTEALYIDVSQKTFQQIVADKVNKRDLVVNFRKPRPGEFGGSTVVIPEGVDSTTFRELACQAIRDYLQANPASTKDRVFDSLVSRMVRAGQMQAHNFDELLREVAEETKDAGGAGRWYLKDTEEGRIDAAEAAKEDAAANAIEKFISKTLEKGYAEGVHYSDLFEHYLYAVNDKPRRSLADWLPDYFYKTEAGTWRLPVDDDERELKALARTTGENRRIKRYAAMLLAGVAVPKERVPSTATLSEWIRHAKRSGLFEAGKLLYERGGLDSSKLNEEQQVEVEEDYQVCVRALQRAAGGDAKAAPKKRGRKKKTETGE
jgi:DNA modification methylase